MTRANQDSDSLAIECHDAYLARSRSWFGRRLRYFAVVPVAAGLVVLQANPAAAWITCPGNLVQYAGQWGRAQDYRGVERYISVDTAAVADPTADHILNDLVVQVNQVGCHGYTECWIQAGYGEGEIFGKVSTSLASYAEENDNYGIAYNWGAFPISQNDFYTIFFTGQTMAIGGGESVGLFDEVTVPAGSSTGYTIVAAWLQYYNHTNVQANTEEYVSTNGEVCPTLAANQYFGTDGTSNNNSNTQLYVSNGTDWVAWPTSDEYNVADYPYDYAPLENYGAFETWKTPS